VKHHVALVGGGNRTPAGDRLFPRQAGQERLIKASGIPYTILHSTQFFEFIDGIIQSGTENGTIHVSPALVTADCR
jgi:uncharacterized protein YbjT (DUF2867 family)